MSFVQRLFYMAHHNANLMSILMNLKVPLFYNLWKNNYKNIDEQNTVIRKEISDLKIKRQRIFELHQFKTYSDQEFINQKVFINKKIAHKKLLIHDKANEEFNIKEDLDSRGNEPSLLKK